MVSFDLPGGMRIQSFPAAPSDFDPLKADDNTLVRYGYPHRPRDPQVRRLWEWALKRVTYVQPEFEVGDRIRRRRGDVFNSGTSNNWSGASLRPADNADAVTNVMGVWTVPRSSSQPGGAIGTTYYCSSWVGIDDYVQGQGQVLFQAGVEAPVTIEPGNPDSGNPYAWIEWLPAPEVRLTSVPVSPGDTVLCALGVDPGATFGSYWFANLTSQRGTSGYFTGGPALTGQYAEWIVERPSQVENPTCAEYASLADYGSITFTSCSAITANNKPHVDLSTAATLNMINCSGATMSSAQIVDPSSLRCQFQGVYH